MTQTIHILEVKKYKPVEDISDSTWYETQSSFKQEAFTDFKSLRRYAYEWFDHKCKIHAAAIKDGRVEVISSHHLEITHDPHYADTKTAMPFLQITFHYPSGRPRKRYVISKAAISRIELHSKPMD